MQDWIEKNAFNLKFKKDYDSQREAIRKMEKERETDRKRQKEREREKKKELG